jgi:hypothetical protein
VTKFVAAALTGIPTTILTRPAGIAVGGAFPDNWSAALSEQYRTACDLALLTGDERIDVRAVPLPDGQ